MRCYNCRGLDHFARNCTVKPRKMDAVYFQTTTTINASKGRKTRKKQGIPTFNLRILISWVAAASYHEIKDKTGNGSSYDPIRSAECGSNVISVVSSMEQSGGIVEQNTATVKETHALYNSLYNNLATKAEIVNSVNRDMKETNVELTTELARYKDQEKCFEINQEKYDKLERLSESFLSQASAQKQQSLYNGKVLLEKHDPLVVYDSKETLQLAQESRLKMKQLNKEIKLKNYAKINHLSGVFVSQKAKSREELYFSNISKAARVSKSISIPNEEFTDDTTPSVARKFLNEISYDKAYNDMQQKIKWLQAQLGDLKGKSKDTPCESDTLDPLSRKLENENVELKFQDTTKGTSTNTKFANQSNERKPSLQSLRNNFVVRQPNAFQSKRLKFSKTRVPPKVDESNDLSNPVTSNSTLPLENQQL
ncbi:retrovirus-related pol polyprotein from transposon TNT 1-94 [Tanacetum coccineum]